MLMGILLIDNKLKNIYLQYGYPLYQGIQKTQFSKLTKSERHYVFYGLYHAVEICIKISDFKNAKIINDFCVQKLPDDYHNTFAKQKKLIPEVDDLISTIEESNADNDSNITKPLIKKKL